MIYRKPFINIHDSLQAASGDLWSAERFQPIDLETASEWLEHAKNSYEPIHDLVKQGVTLPSDCKTLYEDVSRKIEVIGIQIHNAQIKA